MRQRNLTVEEQEIAKRWYPELMHLRERKQIDGQKDNSWSLTLAELTFCSIPFLVLNIC
jgi:hypothetical protein